MLDLIHNGVAQGDIASVMLHHNMDPGAMRPWRDPASGRSFCTVNHQGKLVNVPLIGNAATLRKDEWIELDKAIVKAAKPRLKAVEDLRSLGLTYTIADGMSKTVLQTETQSDINEAAVSMDGLRESQGDRPVYGLNHLPLPIVHKDFAFSARQIAVSRNGNSPLDTTTAELAARRVAEEIEKMLLGISADFTWAGGSIQGYTTLTGRNTKTMTLPTATGWTGGTFINEVLEMKAQAYADFHYGPYRLYVSPNWDAYLDDDYSTEKGDLTLRERARKIEGLQEVVTLDYLTGYTAILVQMTQDVVRLVVGMEITTVQWETKGGMQQNFKVMAIMVPQLRRDHNGNSGIVHGTAA